MKFRQVLRCTVNSFIRISLASQTRDPFASERPFERTSRDAREWHRCRSRGTLYGGLTRSHKDASAIMCGRSSAKCSLVVGSEKYSRPSACAINASHVSNTLFGMHPYPNGVISCLSRRLLIREYSRLRGFR